jgi:precorrin-6B methylase 2
MKLVALLAVIVSFFSDPVVAQMQGFRGAPGGSRDSGAIQAIPSTTQPRQGFANGQVGNSVTQRTWSTPQGSQVQPAAPVTAPRTIANPNHRGEATVASTPVHPQGTWSTPRGTHVQPTPLVIAPRIISIPHQRGGAFIGPQPVHRRPTLAIVGVVPHHHHRPWFFYRYPVATIVEWPYAYSPTVITQIAPGVISASPRYAEEPPSEARTRSPEQLAPFDPTPQEVVERMLTLANVKSSDVLYDLGAGDGRVVIAAAKKYGIRAVGYEIDPGLAKLARENVRHAGVERLVEIREQDFLTADLSRASVVTLYLSYDGNLALRPQLMRQLKPGARVVSYTFDMGEWQPKISETYRDAGGDAHAIYFWQIGDTIAFR